MSDLFRALDYDRFVAGAFVPAELVLDLAARDYGICDCTFDWALDQQTHADTAGWEDFFDLYIGFPESWSIDPAWGLYLRVSVQMTFALVSGSATSYQWRLTSYGTAATGTGVKTLTADIPLASAPTGLQAYTVQLNVDSIPSCVVSAARAVGSATYGLDSWRLVTL